MGEVISSGSLVLEGGAEGLDGELELSVCLGELDGIGFVVLENGELLRGQLGDDLILGC